MAAATKTDGEIIDSDGGKIDLDAGRIDLDAGRIDRWPVEVHADGD